MLGRVEDISTQRQETRPLSGVAEVVRGDTARAQYRRLYRKVAVTDVLSVAAALLVTEWLRFGVKVSSLLDVGASHLGLVLGTPLAVLAAYSVFHLYDAHRYTPAEEFRRIMLAVSLGVTAIAMFSLGSQTDLSRPWLALSWSLAVIFGLASRRVWHERIDAARARGRLSFSTIVVGSNSEAKHLAELMRRPGFGFQPLGVVSTGSRDYQNTGLPMLGTVEDLRDLIRAAGAECIFVASSAMSPEEMAHVAKAVRLEGVEVRVTATLPEVLSSRLSVQPLGGVTALSLRPVRLSGTQAIAKRIFDLTLSGIGLALISPILLVIGLSVKISSSGPILYRQSRVGRGGRPFTMLKFRTMHVGAESRVEELRSQHAVSDLMFKLRHDPRVTRVGGLLRKCSLDELPQLINVLRGEMSLVGPRPPLPEEVTRYEDWQFDRLEVPPGITGLWQVSGRSELSFDDCVRLDLFYIENWSLAYDLYILAKTLPVLVFQRGAF